MNRKILSSELLGMAKDLVSEPKTASGRKDFEEGIDKVLEAMDFILNDAQDWPALSTRESTRHLASAVRSLSEGVREMHKAWDSRDKHEPV